MNTPNLSPLSLKTSSQTPHQMPLPTQGSELPAEDSLDSRVRSLKISKSDREVQSDRKVSWIPWLFVVIFGLLSTYLFIIKDAGSSSGPSNDDSAAQKSGNSLTGLSGQNATSNTASSLKSDVGTSSNSSSNSSKLGTLSATSTKNTADRASGTSRTDGSSASSGLGSINTNVIALEARGYVIAKHQVLVSPQVSGRILSLNIEEGRKVEKGDVLAEVEQTEYRVEVDQLRATLMRTKAELSELEAGARPQELAGAEADLEEQRVIATRLEAQYKRLQDALRSNSISLAEYEEAQSSFLSTRSRIEKLRQSLDMMKEGPRKERIAMAKAAVAQAEANLAKAQWRLDNCTIRAPIAGTILKKNAEEGNLVNPIAFNGSYSVCDIADLSDLEIDLNIQERDVAKVFVGQPCEVRSEAYSKRVYKATVSRLMPIADRAKGAVPVRVAVKVPEGEEGVYLKPEMSAIVVFYELPSS